MGGKGEWQVWLQIIIVVALTLGPVLKGLFELIFRGKDKQPPGPRRAPEENPQRRIHDVLAEMRKEMDQNEPQVREAPAAPPKRQLEDPFELPRPQPRREERPQPPRPKPTARPRVATKPPPKPSQRPQPAQEPGRFEEIEHLQSTQFQELSQLKSTEFQSLEELREASEREVIRRREERKTRPPIEVMGMNAKQLIVAQIVLGPPRSRQ